MRRLILIVSLVAAFGVAACQGSTASPSPTARPTPTSSPTASPVPSPSPTASPTPSPSSTVPSRPVPGAAGAFQTVVGYENALLAGEFEKAWRLLGSGTQARFGSLTGFKDNRLKFLALAGTDFRAQISPNTLTIAEWIVGQSWASKIDVARAYIVSVRWPLYNSTNAEIWIVNPTFSVATPAAPAELVRWDLYLAN